MTKVFGRVHTMSALVFTGNGKGLGGYAVGKVGQLKFLIYLGLVMLLVGVLVYCFLQI